MWIALPCAGDYEIRTQAWNKKIFVENQDGGFMMKHKSIEVEFKHRETGDKVLFKITGKGNCYQTPYLATKEIKLDMDECKEEFIRLLGTPWLGILIFEQAYLSML